MEGYKLFLDDERNPADCAGFYGLPKELYLSDDWVIVRSYRDFVFTIAEQWTTNRINPALVSFDHDLGEEKSGKDCAEWLAKHCLYDNTPMPEIMVHSRNPVGPENISSLLKQVRYLWEMKYKQEADEIALLKTLTEVIHIPKLSKEAKDVIVSKWHKSIGDNIEKGDVLAELETKEAIFDLESYAKGVLLYKGIEDGGTMKVDAVMAVIGICKTSNK